MATIYNSDLTKELIDGAKIQTSRDKVPILLAEKVVPVMEVNPKLLRRINTIRSNQTTASGGLTVFTTPTDKDFYLTTVVLSIVKDAACDLGSGRVSIQVTVDGANREICGIAVLTLTAQNQTLVLSLPIPLKLDRNTTITQAGSGTFAAGTCSRSCQITGYSVEIGS